MAENDGKAAEKKFTAEGKKRMAKDPLWWVHRIPDAAVCMGRIPKQPADYFVMYQGVCALVEVKEEKTIDTITVSRLTQRPKMRRFRMAKGQGFFVISHTESKRWRLVPLQDTLDISTSKMKLGDYKQYKSIEEIYNAIGQSLRHAGHAVDYEKKG